MAINPDVYSTVYYSVEVIALPYIETSAIGLCDPFGYQVLVDSGRRCETFYNHQTVTLVFLLRGKYLKSCKGTCVQVKNVLVSEVFE